MHPISVNLNNLKNSLGCYQQTYLTFQIQFHVSILMCHVLFYVDNLRLWEMRRLIMKIHVFIYVSNKQIDLIKADRVHDRHNFNNSIDPNKAI